MARIELIGRGALNGDAPRAQQPARAKKVTAGGRSVETKSASKSLSKGGKTSAKASPKAPGKTGGGKGTRSTP